MSRAACATAIRPAARRARGSAPCGACRTSSTSTRPRARARSVVARVGANDGAPAWPRCAIGLTSAGRDRLRRRLAHRRAGRRHRALMVVDGLGHGPFAAEAAAGGVEPSSDRPFARRRDILPARRIAACLTARAAAPRACASCSGRHDVQYAGVGNIAGSLVGRGASPGPGVAQRHGRRASRAPRTMFEYTPAPGRGCWSCTPTASRRAGPRTGRILLPLRASGGDRRRALPRLRRAAATMRQWWS